MPQGTKHDHFLSRSFYADWTNMLFSTETLLRLALYTIFIYKQIHGGGAEHEHDGGPIRFLIMQGWAGPTKCKDKQFCKVYTKVS